VILVGVVEVSRREEEEVVEMSLAEVVIDK
jgi:hypothetical protein